jgi:transcriptional regulator with XRE-family HTH domain
MENDVNLVVDKHVGSRVRMRRMMLGMSQEALGGALGLTFQQVQKYEKGVNRVSASRLQHMSQILQVPVPFFFEGAPGGAEGELRGLQALRLTSTNSSPPPMDWL